MIGTVLYLFTQRKKNASAKQLVFFFLCLFLFFFFSLLPSVQRHRFPHNCIPLPAIRSLLVLLKVTNQLFGIVFLECFPLLFFFVNSSPPPSPSLSSSFSPPKREKEPSSSCASTFCLQCDKDLFVWQDTGLNKTPLFFQIVWVGGAPVLRFCLLSVCLRRVSTSSNRVSATIVLYFVFFFSPAVK